MSYAHVNSDAPVDPSGYTRTSLSPDNTNDGQSNKHRRNYQACEGCRQRKVKCDLGPVDAPHPPPCARCRRENRKCDFADTRKKRKSQSPDPEQFDAGHSEKRPRTVSNSQKSSPAAQPGSTGFAGGWSPERPSPSLYPSQHHPSSTPPLGVAPRFPNRMHSFPRPEPPRSVSQIAMPVVTKKDAQSELKSQAAESFINDPIATSERSLTLLAETANSMNRQDDFSAHPQTKRKSKSVISSIPHVNRDGSALDAEQLGEYRKAVSMWNKVTFVHSRFFSAEEGIAYVDYFYDKLQPMSPVVVPDYRDVSKHSELWTSEPILALTMLTIASRYKELTGVSATSRQYTIHDHLWKALTNRVQRLLWGQEQFGGGRLGKTREMANGQLTWTGSLRTLGTIEALLLLTDWQPRSLHFPPGNDEISLLAENLAVGDDLDDATDNHQLDFDAQETGPHTSWLEPAWRSDRMSWDLLSLALALSCELGVFDDPEKRLHRFDPDLGRKNRIRRLLTVYSAQTSGRIGIPSILRFDDSITDLSLEANRGDRVERMQGLWVHIAHIMDEANKQIFPSREYTIGLTHGNEYRERIQHFMPLLHKWMNHFTREREALDDVMVSILLMEYEYARLYINSIGLQHVVESWVRDGSSASNMARSVSENKQYIDEFTEAALHILEIVCGKMNDLGVLRDAPVRTFLRTLSAMMFTLKRLSMGNHEKMVRKSIDLLEQVTKLLTTQVVDDVHLSGSTARMIGGILSKVKATLIRVQKRPNTSGQPSREHSRAPSPHAHNGDHNHHRFLDPNQDYSNLPPFSTSYSDPLASIEARPIAELMDRTFIPPPGFNFQTQDFDAGYMDDTGIDQSVHSDGQADWITMPLDALYNKDHFRVDQGLHGVGPTVGQHDMLEVLTQAPFDQHALPWLGQDQTYTDF